MTSPLPSLGGTSGSPENFLSTSPAWPNPTSSIEFFLGRGASQDDDDRFKVASSLDSDHLDHSSADINDDPGHFLRSSADDHPSNQRDTGDILSYNWSLLFAPEEKDRRTNAKHVVNLLQSALLENRPSFRQQLPRIVRLAHECPFPDIKKFFQDFLQLVAGDLEKRNIKVPEVPRPSKFFKEGVYPVDTSKEPQASVFKELFLQTGRVSHLDRLFAWHPTYQEVFLKTFNFIMRADGPLPHPMRNYIAILAASRFKCLYLVKQQEEEFLLNGGDPSWLEGIERIPPKMQKLLEINSILAHQPWLIKKEHIDNLIRGDDPFTRWSTAELVQAFVLMSSFRSLASFVWGMGVNSELDFRTHSHDGLSSTSSPNPEPIDLSDDVNQNTLQIIDKLKKALASVEEDLTSTPEQRRQLFEQAGSEPEGPKPTADGSWGDLTKYIGSYTLQHQDFDVRAKDYEVFHEDDYSWQEQGYELVQRYYSGSAELLDEEFTHIFELTYNKFNDQQGVDTAPFRRSVWYYVHRIFGVIHDDYDYSLVNAYMNRRMKAFIKKVVCQPHQITIADVGNLGYHLQPQEKCHLALLAVEARKQAELLYGLHAVMKLMSS